MFEIFFRDSEKINNAHKYMCMHLYVCIFFKNAAMMVTKVIKHPAIQKILLFNFSVISLKGDVKEVVNKRMECVRL